MERIYQIIKENNLSNKSVNTKSKSQIILRRNFFYSVKLILTDRKQISIIKNWRLGILGKIIFRKKDKEYISFLNMVKNCLMVNEYVIIPLYYFPR